MDGIDKNGDTELTRQMRKMSEMSSRRDNLPKEEETTLAGMVKRANVYIDAYVAETDFVEGLSKEGITPMELLKFMKENKEICNIKQ